MTFASYASLQLVRFDAPRISGDIQGPAALDVLFCGVGADSRAAGAEPASRVAFVFLLLGLHPSLESAQRLVASGHSAAPWMRDAVEAWAAVLQPFRHTGESNLLDRVDGGPLFNTLTEPPGPNEPIVIMTSAGWRRKGIDPERIRVFANGVEATRAGMTDVAGLHSQQAFFFPGVLEYDPVTITTWRNADAMRAWAYGPGVHRQYLDRHRNQPMSDRTSFTRYRILQSTGTWYGDAL